jgi:hypothetical protein
MHQLIAKDAVVFPQGSRMANSIAGFSQHLPQCAGAMHACYIPLTQPQGAYSSYWWCKQQMYAIKLIGVVNSNGEFVYAVADRASVPICKVFAGSFLPKQIEEGTFLSPQHSKDVAGTTVRPFLVADAAFPLEPHIMTNIRGRMALLNTATIRGTGELCK